MGNGPVISLGSSLLTASPGECSEGQGGFPAGSATVPLSLLPQLKPYLVSTGDQVVNVATPSGFTALAMGSVTQGHTLYLRTTSAVVVELTMFGNATPQQINVQGLVVLEFDPAHYLTAVGVQGSGLVEYLAVGNA
jgi:hypothetical protein